MKKVVKPSSINQIVYILGQLWRIFTKLINIARLYVRYQIRGHFFINNRGGDNQSMEPFQYPKNGSNLNFTLIEKVAGMTIFHGVSRHKIDEEDLETIEKICTKDRPGVSATVSLENADPHLFKIVIWNENSA